MKGTLAGFCAGCLLVQWLPQLLPPLGWAVLLALLPLLFWCARRYRRWWPLALVGGFLLTQAQLHGLLQQRLPADFDQVLRVSGQVVSIPRVAGERVRFLLRSEHVSRPDQQDQSAALGPDEAGMGCLPVCVLRVDWYRHQQVPRAGERWRFNLRLRPPHGPVNHLGFDAERQALSQGFAGTGVVRGQDAVRLSAASGGAIAVWRQHSAEWLQGSFSPATAAVLRALLLGDRGGLDEAAWEDLTRTGTGHLIAISGLHVGLVGAMGYALMWLLALCRPQCLLRFPLPLLGAVGALAAAATYAFCAGFLLPTQRALAMVVAGLLILLARRRADPWLVWWWALAVVLAAVPQAPLGAGLWLSFGAVAWLIYGFYQRPTRGVLRGFLKAQLLVSLGLLPLSLLFFQQLSVVGPLVNLLAVPWVSVVVLPLGLLVWIVHGLGGDWLWLHAVLEHAVQALLWLIHAAAQLPWASWQHDVSQVAALAALSGMVWLLAPRGLPLRPLGAVWCLPLLLPLRAVPAVGDFWVYHFDVGQGLAVAVRTQSHMMLYDTGPGDGHGRDWLRAAMLPRLRQWGAPPLDLLMLSHGDLDHAGGAASAGRWLRPRRVLSSDTAVSAAGAAVTPCVHGQRWTWDGVTFTVLHPGPYLPYLGNDSSCVLSISGRHGRLLLPGDLGRQGERLVLSRLASAPAAGANVAQPPPTVRATVLALGHHGSRTSSSAEWLQAVAPAWALLSRSRYNRFGFPHEEVVERLRAAGIPWLDSAACGGLWLRFTGPGPLPQVTAARHRRGWWRSAAKADCITGWATAGP